MPADVQNMGELEDQLVPQVPEEQSQPAEAAPPQPQAGGPASAPALPPSLLQRAQQAGLPLDGINDTEGLAQAILDQYIQSRPYADYGRSSLANSPAVNPNQRPADQDAAEDEQESFDVDGHFQGLWKVPEVSQEAKFLIQNGAIVQDEEGRFVAKQGYESLALPHLSAVNAANMARQEQLRSFFDNNPYKTTYDGLKPAFERMVDARVQQILEQRFSERDQGSYVEQFVNENRGWLMNPDGQTISPQGQKFQEAVQELRDSGITDPKQLAKYAMKLAGIDTHAGSGQQDAGKDAAAIPAPNTGLQRDGQGRFLPAGTPAPAAPPPKPQETFLDKARKASTQAASQADFGENNPDYVPGNDGELENMFSNAGRKAGLYA